MDRSFSKILLLLNQGRWNDAESAARMAIGESPEDSWNYGFLAEALLAQDRLREGESAIRRAIELAPESDGNYCCLARILCERKRYKEALRAIGEALEIDPDDADYHAVRARIFNDSDKPKKALAAAMEGLRLDPDNDHCQFHRGVALTRLGDDDAADAQFNEMLADDPEDAANHIGRGWSKVAAGDFQAAHLHFGEAMRLEPGREDARHGLVTCMKARNPAFGWLLRITMILERYQMVGLIALIVLFIAGTRVIRGAADAMPHLNWLWHSLWVGMFVVLLFLTAGHSLFAMLLSLKKEGRLALSRDELRAARWNWPLLVVGVAYLAIWISSGRLIFPHYTFICFIGLRAVDEVFECSNRWVRKRLGWMVAVALFAALASPYLLLLALFLAAGNKGLAAGILQVFPSVLLFTRLGSLLLLTFVDNIRTWLERRAPDCPE